MTGFLGEIERRRQQDIQEGLVHKAEAEKQIRLVTQETTDRQAQEQLKHEVNAAGFISDCQTLISILGQFDALGYKDYLNGVSKITGFDYDLTLYMNYYWPDLDSRSGNKAPELDRKQLQLKEEVTRAFHKSSPHYSEVFLNDYRKDRKNQSAKTEFFGVDNIVTEKHFWEPLPTKPPKEWFTEPKETALGIRFKKEADWRKKVLKSGSGYNSSWSQVLHQRWLHAVYVRISDEHRATITGGSLQLQTDFSNIKMFDDALAKAMTSPTILYEKTIEDRSRYWGPDTFTPGR